MHVKAAGTLHDPLPYSPQSEYTDRFSIDIQCFLFGPVIVMTALINFHNTPCHTHQQSHGVIRNRIGIRIYSAAYGDVVFLRICTGNVIDTDSVLCDSPQSGCLPQSLFTHRINTDNQSVHILKCTAHLLLIHNCAVRIEDGFNSMLSKLFYQLLAIIFSKGTRSNQNLFHQ